MKRKTKTYLLMGLLLVTVVVLAACSQGDSCCAAPSIDSAPAVSAGSGTGSAPSDAATNTVFGRFTAETFSGETVTEELFARSRLTMVNIWATFCGPCINEMPELGEISAEYADKDFAIVGIPVDIFDRSGKLSADAVANARDIISATKADYPHLIASAELQNGKLSEVVYVPETVFIDQNGNQVGKSYTGSRSKAAWLRIIDDLLKEVNG